MLFRERGGVGGVTRVEDELTVASSGCGFSGVE